MYRFTKIQPYTQPVPFNFSQSGVIGPVFFKIGANSWFNLAKSQFVCSFSQPAVGSRYACSTALASQLIQRITIRNSSGVIEDINDAHLYSQSMLCCVKSDGYGRSNFDMATQAVGDQNRKHNIMEAVDASLLYNTVSINYAQYPMLYTTTSLSNTVKYNTLSADLSVMYPKTFFAMDRDVYTEEELTIEITFNPTDLFCWYTIAAPSSNLSREATISTKTDFSCTYLYMNVFTPNPKAIHTFTESFVDPEIQKFSTESLIVQNVRTTLKPREVLFINWAPYDGRAPTYGRLMYPFTVTSTTQDASWGGAGTYISTADIRVNGQPIKQLAPLNISQHEHLLYNRKHVRDSVVSSDVFQNNFYVDITCIDEGSIYDLDANTYETLNLTRPTDLTLDIVNNAAQARQFVFVIGYKRTIHYSAGRFHF